MKAFDAGSPPWKNNGSRSRRPWARCRGYTTLAPISRAGRVLLIARVGSCARRMERAPDLDPSAPTSSVPVAVVPSVNWAVTVSWSGVEIKSSVLDHWNVHHKLLSAHCSRNDGCLMIESIVPAHPVHPTAVLSIVLSTPGSASWVVPSIEPVHSADQRRENFPFPRS